MTILLIIFFTGIFSGFVDAIAGGGLIMIPGLLIIGMPITSAISTNKLCGTFLVFALLSVLPLDFLRGTGTAKVINLMTNVTALISFLILNELFQSTTVI